MKFLCGISNNIKWRIVGRSLVQLPVGILFSYIILNSCTFYELVQNKLRNSFYLLSIKNTFWLIWHDMMHLSKKKLVFLNLIVWYYDIEKGRVTRVLWFCPVVTTDIFRSGIHFLKRAHLILKILRHMKFLLFLLNTWKRRHFGSCFLREGVG